MIFKHTPNEEINRRKGRLSKRTRGNGLIAPAYDLRWKFINGANRDNRLTFPRYRAAKIVLIVVGSVVSHVMLTSLSIITLGYFIVAGKPYG